MKKLAVLLCMVLLAALGLTGCAPSEVQNPKDLGKNFNKINEANMDKVVTESSFVVDEKVPERNQFEPMSLITDGMILQRNAVTHLYGDANFDGPCAAMINGKTFYGLSENSRFDIYLAPMEAGGPYTLVLYSKQGKTTISDVLIGEVILCSGQSNMEWTVGNSIELGDQGLHGPDQMALAGGRYIPDPVRDPDTYSDWVSDSAEREEMIKNLYKTETQNYRNDKLRLFKVQITTPIIENADVYRGIAQTPQIDFIGSWKKAGPESISEFSAVGFFFGRKLCEQTNIPVGLVMSAVGATYASTWVPRETYEEATDSFCYVGTDANDPWNLPSRCYNLYIAPLSGYTFHSFLWLQGEGQVTRYKESLVALIQSWRDGFQQPNLGCVIVGFPMSGYYGHIPDGYAENSKVTDPVYVDLHYSVREQQQAAAAELENVTWSVNLSNGDYDEIHQWDKLPVGENTCDKFMEYFYQTPGVLSGPVVAGWQLNGAAVEITFTGIGSGLLLINDGRNFELADASAPDEFYPAKAELIAPDQVRVTCDKVQNACSVRYGCLAYPRLTRTEVKKYFSLFNKEGYSADQFFIDLTKTV